MADETVPGDLHESNTYRPLIATPRIRSQRTASRDRARQRVRAIKRAQSPKHLRLLSDQRRPHFKHRPAHAAIKQMIDICSALVGLTLLAPLLAGIAITIRLSSKGPILFRQTRLGRKGQPFSIFKFRTMYAEQCDASGLSHTVDGDPRITRIGRFLRRSSFDELPQLLNVVRGEMSLVGPRPYVPGMRAAGVPYERLDHRYYDRLLVRPGITGLAQANGLRGDASDEAEARKRLEYDLLYVEQVSLWLDMKLIFKTVCREFFTGSGN